MQLLYDLTQLNEVSIRLRFLIAKQVELALSGLFPKASAYPFGSSVNGYGKMGCDLDLVLRLNENTHKNKENRLVFHCKSSMGSERSTLQRQMETIGDILQLFLPGCTNVRRILQARVPIIKYYQQLADVECDLSMFNMSGVHMSDFLYLMGSIDSRVRPLVFTIRKWASEVGITNSTPGRWITNFSLTLLVLAFLQKPSNSKPLLPSLNSLIKQAELQDKYVTEDGVNFTFLRDGRKLKETFYNNDNLYDLLLKFFEFYSEFDFNTKAISLNEGIPITKPEHSALYIVNPLEKFLNVSKNVSIEELERFKMEARNAIWCLESQEEQVGDWGILSLFNRKSKYSVKSKKLIDVSKLFSEDGESIEEEVVNLNRRNNLNKRKR